MLTGTWHSLTITCKRGSAKHSVKDDHAFLWEHAILTYLPSRNPSPIKMKFCTIDYVGELTRCAKNGLNQLAECGPTVRWNIISTFVLYLTLPFFYSCMPLQPKRLNRFARTMSQTTRFAVRKCLLGSRWYEITFRGRNPHILEPDCQISSQINTLE